MSARYTRVTLAGTRRRVDVVIPSDETVGRLLPEVIRLTGEPPAAPPARRHLAALDGTLLDFDVTLAQAGIADGALLRLVGLADAPPPPVVHDVIEETADDLDRRRWRWNQRARHGLAAAVLAAGAVVALHLGAAGLGDPARTAALIGMPIVLLLLGAITGRALPAPIGVALLASAGATGALAVFELASGMAETGGGLAGVAAVLALGFGMGTSAGRGALIGGLAGLALFAGWTAAAGVGVPAVLVAAGAAVVSIAVLGLLPRLALISSGLTALDDRRSRDIEVNRADVTTALSAAHRGLALAAVAAAVSAVFAGLVLGLHPTAWTASLGALLAVVLILRARSFPLVGPVVALTTAATVTAVALLAGWLATDSTARLPATAIAAAITVLTFCALVVEPPDHVRARIRRAADRLELVAVVASVPVALGVSGLYGHLLRVF